MAFSLVQHRIRINGLNIGWMDSPGEDRVQKENHNAPDNWLVETEKRQPFGRLLKTEEVALGIAFIFSDESGMMTGSIIDFDQSIVSC